MELILEKQPRKYLASVDAPTRIKLHKALDRLKELDGDIVRLEGTKNHYRMKLQHYRIIFSYNGGKLIIVETIDTRTNIKYRGIADMNPAEFKKKLAALPAQKPDAIDRAMLAEAAAINDGSIVPLEEFEKTLVGYSGRIALRIPRSLHKSLKEAAATEGVSLNQYMIYKLSRPD